MLNAVSVILPVYNGARYLDAAIESVLKQTTTNLELVVWDDGSTDNSFSIASSYAQHDERVRVFREEHKGHAASLNNATAKTTGQYIGWIDSDDLLAPTALEETSAILDSQPATGLVYTDYIVIDEFGEERKFGGRCSIPYSKERLLESFMTFHFRLFRRSAFEQVGGTDESLECAVDYDLCLKLSEITEFVHLERSLYYYRSHSNNVSHLKLEQQDLCARKAIANAVERRTKFNDSRLLVSSSAESLKPKKLTFYWSSSKQLFACDHVFHENQGQTPTSPSHDLVHLIVAANGSLSWLPQRHRSLACLAEYNAVLLEQLFDRTCNATMRGKATSCDVFTDCLNHMSWFVNEHFAPFPVSEHEAYQQFCAQINPFIVSRLFPYYFSVRQHELTNSNHRESEYQLTFASTDQPAIDEIGYVVQWLVYQQLKIAQSQAFAIEHTNIESTDGKRELTNAPLV